MWKRVVISIALFFFLVANSGCNNFELEGPEAYIAAGFRGPKISAKKVAQGENNGQEYLSRNTGVFSKPILPMVGQNSN